MNIFEMIVSTPDGEWEHIIVCEDGQLIPIRFVKPNDADIQWAKGVVLGLDTALQQQ